VLVWVILTLRITAFGRFMKDDQATQCEKIKFVDIFSQNPLQNKEKYAIISSVCAVFAQRILRVVRCDALHERPVYKEGHDMDMIKAFTSEQLKETVPSFNIGDTVRVHNKIKEGNKERIQMFEGTVIAKHNGGISATFTVRRISYGVGVEKTFPVHSPNVVDVTVIRRGKVRRAKLYYLRDRVGKASKVKEQMD